MIGFMRVDRSDDDKYYGCICAEDFVSAEYYDPAAHLDRLIADIEWEKSMKMRGEQSEK